MEKKLSFTNAGRKICVIFCFCMMIAFFFLYCSDLPPNPFVPSNAKMSLVLVSSKQLQSESMIADSSGHTVSIGLICFMPKFIDSLKLKILLSGTLVEKDTVFKGLEQVTGYDTIWYNKAFAYSGTRSVQATAYLKDSGTIYKSGVIVIEGLQNAKPSIAVTGSRNLVPGSACTLSVSGIDDHQNLTYSVSNNPAGSVLTGNKFIWTPTASDTGLFNVTFKVTDDGLPPLSDSVSVQLVIDLSLPLPIKPTGIVVTERKATSVLLKWQKSKYADIYQVYQSADNGVFTLRNSIYDTSFTDVIGSAQYRYYVTAKNRIGEISSDTVFVSSFNVSNPVWNTDSFDIALNEGQIYELNLPNLCKVANSDSLIFTLLSIDSISDTINPLKSYLYTPGYSDAGSYQIIIGAKYQSFIDTFKINIRVINKNRAPVFLTDMPKSNQFVLEADTLNVKFGTVDPDGDLVTYALKNVTLPRSTTPELSTIDNMVKWVSQTGDSGSYTAELVAYDGTDSTVAQISVFVGKGNVAPSWKQDTMTVTINEMETCSLDLHAISADLNNDTLTYALLPGLPAADTIIDNRYYIYRTTYSDSGTSLVNMLVSDSTLTDEFKLTLRVLNVNRKPQVSGMNDTTLIPGVTLLDTLFTADSDSDPVSVTAVSLPSGALFNAQTGIFTFTSSDQGTYSFAFSATDGKDTVVKNLTITVSLIAAPVITLQPSAITTCEGQPAVFIVKATGVGVLNYQWQKDGTSLDGKTKDTLFITSVATADSGNYSCSVMNAGGPVQSASVKLSVSKPSVKPTQILAEPSTICLGESSVLSVSGGSLGTNASKWLWYRDPLCTVPATGFSLIKILNGSQLTVTPDSIGTFKYYVTAKGLCNTTLDSVTLTVVSKPSVPNAMNDTTIFEGDSVTLTTSIFRILPLEINPLLTRTTLLWYAGSCGGTAIKSTKVAPTSSTTYYVKSSNGVCTSECDSVLVTVKPILIIKPIETIPELRQ